jgi:hypothetical protein
MKKKKGRVGKRRKKKGGEEKETEKKEVKQVQKEGR